MHLNFAAVLAQLGPDAAFRIMNAARPPADYLFATFLPERARATYNVRSGSMTIRATMAGMVGMDSPYPPSGISEVSTFHEETVKIANQVTLTEAMQRELQLFLATLGQGQQSDEMVRNTVLNFLDKLVIQAHLDTMEYLRASALTTGKLDWTFNKKRLQVDYGVPSGNLFSNKTGNNGYGGSASKFWEDHRRARSKLKGRVRAILAHPETIDMIISNPANDIIVTAQDAFGGASFVKVASTATNTGLPSGDARDRVSLVAYGAEGEILDVANPGRTVLVPFMPLGKIVYVGEALAKGFQVGDGSTENAQNEIPLGYTHVGPTVEGGGAPGRWADLMTPPNQPWQVVGRGVTNGLPVLEAPEKLVVLSTEMV